MGSEVSLRDPLTGHPISDVYDYKKDVVNSILYYEGWAKPGSATSSAVWQIRRTTIYGDITTRVYANQGDFKSTWDSRTAEFPAAAFSNNYSLMFDGVNDYVTFGDTLGVEMSQQWSFSLWFFADNFSAQRCLYSKTTSDANVYGLSIQYTTSGTAFIQIRASGQLTSHTGSIVMSAGVWYHLVVTNSGNQNLNGIRVYINGVVDTTPASAAITNTLLFGQHATLGRRNAGFYHSGNIDEVTKWSKQLSGSEVTTLYNGGSPLDPQTVSFVSNLQNYWRMGDGDAYPTIFDNVGLINGTVLNGLATDFELDVP